MLGYKINWWRLAIATIFVFEVGDFFGYDHIIDRSPAGAIATGIAFLLFSLSIEASYD